MSEAKSITYSNIKIRTGTHTRLKICAVTKGIPLQDLVDKALTDWLDTANPVNPADQAEELRSMMSGA